MVRLEVCHFQSEEFNKRYNVSINVWCEGKWYVAVIDDDNHNIKYLRNDGQLFGGMQLNVSDLSGGTYFNTQQDADEAANRFMQRSSSDATENANNEVVEKEA